jgi:hypothetical protein
MGKAKLKIRRKNMPKHKQNALMDDIALGQRSREECVKYYGISNASYYRYAALAKDRKVDKPVHGPFKPVVVGHKSGEPVGKDKFLSGVVIRMSDLDKMTGRYLTGMAMAFDKTIAEVLDDLVEVAVEIGTAHIHAKKAK